MSVIDFFDYLATSDATPTSRSSSPTCGSRTRSSTSYEPAA